MEELQRKLNQRYEDTKPRKVRFKLASSYSGRVLKHVYEDGQELDSPEEKYPHSFIHRKIPPSHLEMEQLCGFEDTHGDQQSVYPPTGLIAQRINVYRGMGSYKPAVGQTEEGEGDSKSPVLDFGKIIIYTSNLRIIKAPQKKPEMFRQHTVPLIDLEGYPKAKERGSRRRAKAVFTQEEAEKEEKQICDTDTKVMILGQIILSGVVRFYHPISVSCFSHSRHVLLPIPLSLHVSSAIFSSLYLCFQENNCRIFFCFCLTPKSPLFPCKCKLVCILIRFLFYRPAATATNLLS
ncbi:glutaredoxin domain-containing cysteine-rich protein 1 isoform X1 [Astatotilapia calliptera]|uniref:glutaredoxin domain-containing cysteine-rich protein 1 isoform X1 n=1 Tax=Astatotilapia calliptera TaxID=8154 RepID=UPI000E418A08|nr:glutaredoxin domain-containing cysteine-rich protein 2 isoform X1 [Astatotilapia calliptera]